MKDDFVIELTNTLKKLEETLSRVEEDHPKLFSHDWEGIAGWEPYREDRGMFFQREIRPH